MKNIEKYKGIVLKHLSHCDIETDIRKQEGKAAIDCPHTSCEECQEKFFKWLLEEYKEPILDDAERKYLSDVIRPFRKEVATISKFNAFDGRQYIYIEMKDRRGSNLPTFPKDTMYKGMIEGMHYSLKELGL